MMVVPELFGANTKKNFIDTPAFRRREYRPSSGQSGAGTISSQYDHTDRSRERPISGGLDSAWTGVGSIENYRW
jgi:hypothetical protein